MKMNTQGIHNSLHKLSQALYRYRVILFIAGLVGCYGFLITRIGAYTQREPSSQVSEQAIKRLTIDEESIQKIKDLEDQNVEVRALFERARNNPFSE